MSDDKVFADRPSNRTEPPDIDPVALLAGTDGWFWYRCEANHTSRALVSPVGRSCSALIHDDGSACIHLTPAACADASPCGAEIDDWIIDFDAGLDLAAALAEARARITALEGELEDARLRCIEVSNPGIDMDKVRRQRNEITVRSDDAAKWTGPGGAWVEVSRDMDKGEVVLRRRAALDEEGTT